MYTKKAVVVFQRLCKLLKTRVKSRNAAANHEWVSAPFSLQEMNAAETCILKFTQKCYFKDDLKKLEGDNHKKYTPLLNLDPFLQDGLIRVGGRLAKSSLSEDEKHPVVLPKQSAVTTLVIRDVHERLAHSGRNHVLASVRGRFWVVAGNAAVRGVISKCVTCRRLRGQTSVQKMADLPETRTSTEAPFTYTGTDLFGPFLVKEGRKIHKRYGVIFTCFSSRAVHLEIVNSLETDTFINSLRRFLARRGPVHTIYCDNGTNFVGAERELRTAIKEMQGDRIQRYLLGEQIQWSFNPPAASHFGGVWERQIRTIRNVFSSVLRECDRLDDDVCRTLFCEVEAIVNSRPLTTVSSDPNDMSPLSPSQILTMKSQVLVPPPGEFQRHDVYMRKRWRRVQYLANLFWSRWKKEYLSSLQSRRKWKESKRNMRVGDVVLINDDCLPRNEWKMGRVTEVAEDAKGFVRSCTVRTQTSTLKRPIHKLVLLLSCD